MWMANFVLLLNFAERRKLSMQRATYEYLRGKILDVFPDYKKEAEDHLSKAVSEIDILLIFCIGFKFGVFIF